MLLTNQKTINYEIYNQNRKETTPFYITLQIYSKLRDLFSLKLTLTEDLAFRNSKSFIFLHNKKIIAFFYDLMK